MWNGDMTHSMWGTGWLSMIPYMGLFWIIALLAVVAVVWTFMRRGSDTTHRDASCALQVLEERYARGEIGKEEFLNKRHDLTR